MTLKAFECRMCGHCCHGEGGIIMSEKDRQRLALHLGISVEELLEKYSEERNGKISLGTGDDGYCVFFKDGCGVHPGRPDICRAWPFFRGNLIDSMSWEMIQEYCPGVNPEAGHAEFVRQGRQYLRDENLLRYDPATDPNALITDED
ncbi:YkgJ family cysteine cluster protein [Salidesulfovibrio onnuriiensis]|uniref:YkgJ family cysteine cluster protein n=1 Tax=Salidesulfovibrio onnuriiensis TaxID=2583823 RepID=UPI0011CB0EEC|nr:YkgJ family cysteine cluster protein [Salidesulfovibrio onnuriiensis]